MNGMTIITNAYVITCDPAHRAGRLTLLIRGGVIVDVAAHAETMVTLHPNATVIDASNRLVIPGFVNAHHHAESFLLKERTQGKHLGLWKRDTRLQEARTRLASPGSDDDVRMLTLACYFSHLRAGTTTVGEYPLPLDERGLVTLMQAIERTDVRAVVTLRTWDQIRQAKDLGDNRPPTMVSLGSEEDFTVYSFEHLLKAAAELNVPSLAHVGEQREDADPIRKNFQKETLAVLRDFGALRSPTCLVHLNHVPAETLSLVEEAGLSVVLCLRSALWKQSGYPSLRPLLERKIPLALGTDWGGVDMLAEMQFLHQLPLIVPGIPRLTPLEILRMGTINGAAAIGRADKVGSIEPGKDADLTFFSLESLGIPDPGDHPTAEDLARILLTALTSRDIADVMIGGEYFLTRGQIMTMSEEDLSAGYRKLVQTYIPAHHVRPRSEKSPVRAKILPLMPDEERPGASREGFQEGFEVRDDVAGDLREPFDNLKPVPPHPAPPSARGRGSLPELSKDVRRVFGDDDV